ncbi:MAG TPA: hypothetical protein ENF32_06070, partial [Thermosulfidibacter takaii]|nr:hypothetical protein [Thermosulfidibacter takaii]
KVAVGDKVIIAAYAHATEEEAKNWQPTVVLVDDNNLIVEVRKEGEGPFTVYAA